MITNRGDHLFLVVNAACKDADFELLKAGLSDTCDVTMLDDRALIALQGPHAEAVLGELWADVSAMRFMDVAEADLHDVTCIIPARAIPAKTVSRSPFPLPPPSMLPSACSNIPM